MSALGAGPKGIIGITSGGNKAGDVVRAHGTALYKRDGDRWVPVASGGYQPADGAGVRDERAAGRPPRSSTRCAR